MMRNFAKARFSIPKPPYIALRVSKKLGPLKKESETCPLVDKFCNSLVLKGHSLVKISLTKGSLRG